MCIEMDALINLVLIDQLENEELEEENEFENIRNPINHLTDNMFHKLFRIDKGLFEILLDMVAPFMEPKKRLTDLDIPLKVLVAMRFFASGSYQTDIGANINLNVSQSSVSRCVNEFINVCTRPEIMNQWVKFPENIRELNAVRRRFYEKYEFPGVIGCIDCTHVAIFPPSIDDPQYPEYVYINRKMYHSLNVQLICDDFLHDSYIWNRSNVKQAVEALHQNGYTDYFLLGDSGYPLRTYLLTPTNPEPQPNTTEYRYNIKHTRVRSIIERCNGVLKMRFRCLFKHRVLHYKPQIASKIVNTCVVLHNLCITYNLEMPDDDDEDEDFDFGIFNNNAADEEEDDNIGRVNPDLAQGRITRRRIINQNFA